jgi:predicted  nucleic acid-binding Zn-ribbon protein
MKLQTTTNAKSVKTRKKPIQRRGEKTGRKKNVVKTALLICLPISMLFTLGVAIARFNSESETLNRHATKLEMRIHKRQREISDLKVKLERMKGRFVLRQVKHFNLDLTYPTPGQVLYLRGKSGGRYVWNRRYRGKIAVSKK